MDIAPTEVFEHGWAIDPLAAPTGAPPPRGSRLRHLPRRRRWWVLATAVALVAVVVAATVAWAAGGSARSAYRPVAATTGTMRLTTAASGTLRPAQQAALSFQVSGQVTAVPVSVGQHVTAGQTLATVSSAGLSAQVAQAQAALSADEAKLSADQSSGASGAQLDADQAAVTAAQAALSNARASLSQATLTSPISGTVAAVSLTVGQQVAGGSGGGTSGGGSGTGAGAGSGAAGGVSGGGASTGAAGSGAGSSAGGAPAAASGTAQVVVVGGAFVVDVSVDDTQVGLLRDGEQAVILPQGSTTPVYGTVTSVGLLASSTSGVASFPAVITVTGTPRGLFAGATVSVTIVYRQLNDVLEVPAAAVRYAGGRASVLESRAGDTVSVPVTVGAAAGGAVQITSGLSAGQQVLIPQTGTPRTGASAGPGGGRGGFGGGGFGGGGFGGGGFGGRGGAGG